MCRREVSSEALRRELRSRLLCLLPFDAYCVNTCDVVSGLITSSVGDGLSAEAARRLFELEASGTDVNSLSELATGVDPVRGLSLSTRGAPAQSRRMRDIFSPLGFADELRAALFVDHVCYGYLHLFRRAERGPFTPRDLALVRAVVPAIARGLRGALRRALRDMPDQRAESAVLVVDARDCVVAESAGATARLALLDTTGSGLAHVVRATAGEARQGRPARATAVGPQYGRLSVRAVSLGRDTAIVLDDVLESAGAAVLLKALGLTPRELQVAALVAAGRSNQELADELGIALHTAKDHLKAILRKAECSSRGKLLARLRGL